MKLNNYCLYLIYNNINGGVYVGITNNISNRWSCHKSYSKKGNSYLCNAIRKYGLENFSIHQIAYEMSKKDAGNLEIFCISYLHKNKISNYNMHKGGTIGFSMLTLDNERIEIWRNRLKEARIDRKPALGMKHTKDNKALFGKFGKARWDKYGRYPDNVTLMSWTDANAKHGISKTQYYRLKRKKLQLIHEKIWERYDNWMNDE